MARLNSAPGYGNLRLPTLGLTERGNSNCCMIYPIVKYGNPVLDKVAETVTEFNAGLEKLVADMWETMYAASGVGLAAPQIGISKNLCIIDISSGENTESKLVLVNPTILSREGKTGGGRGVPEPAEHPGQHSAPRDRHCPGTQPEGQRGHLEGPGIAGPRFCARDRPPERRPLHQARQHAEARIDQTANPPAK